jgi:predicted AlkP superfamily phosphohydrolase/phosphomutase
LQDSTSLKNISERSQLSVKKALVIGLDGASFNIIDPLVEKGHLPNLARIMSEGRSYHLKSTIPSNTPVAWTSMTTGQNPGKHGIFGFLKYDHPTIKVVSSQDNKALCLWDYLGEQGKPSVIINLPFTWPPKKINGVMACFDWAIINNESKLAEPASVNTYIKEQALDRIASFHPELGNPDLERYHEIVKKQTQFTLDMAKQFKWELLFVVFMVTDSVVHLYPTRKQMVDEVYRIVDTAVGQLLNLVDLRKDRVFITSDHGTKIFDRVYPLPAFFREQRLLRLKTTARSSAELALVNLVLKILEQYHVKLPVSIKNLYKKITGRKKTRLSLRDIVDKQHSPIFVCDENSRIDVLIRLTDRSLANERVKQSIRKRIVDRLNLNETVIRHAWTSDEIYSGPHIEGAPDIILEMAENVAADISSSSFYEKPRSYPSYKGGHIRNGILIAAGNSISQTKDRNVAHVADIAPTILHTLQLTIPLNLDGRVLLDLFEPDSVLGKPPSFDEVQTQKNVTSIADLTAYNQDEEEQMKARLQKLGYL